MVVPVRPYVSFAQCGKLISALTFLWWQFSWQWNVNVRYLLKYHNDEKTQAVKQAVRNSQVNSAQIEG